MKTLVLMRHAKSDWTEPEKSDRARPLNPRGERASPLMGAWLLQQNLVPDTAFVSSSVRTRQTWEIMSAGFDTKPDVSFRDDLYLADLEALYAALLQAETARRLLLLAHNPGLELFASSICTTQLRFAMPTAAILVFEFDVDNWRDIGPASGHLLHRVAPKDLV